MRSTFSLAQQSFSFLLLVAEKIGSEKLESISENSANHYDYLSSTAMSSFFAYFKLYPIEDQELSAIAFSSTSSFCRSTQLIYEYQPNNVAEIVFDFYNPTNMIPILRNRLRCTYNMHL